MKILFLIISIFLLSSPSWSETLTMDDLVERDEIYFKKFTNVPFTGEISGLENGKLKNGKKDGEWLSYHENGQLMYVGNFKDGKEEGLSESYHDNGKLFYKVNFKEGKKEGLWQEHNSKWFTSEKGNYKNGKREGLWESYHENGLLNSKVNYKNGAPEDGLWEWYNKDGSVGGTETWRNGYLINCTDAGSGSRKPIYYPCIYK